MTSGRRNPTTTRRAASGLILVAAAWLWVGCAVHVRPSAHRHRAARAVVVEAGHVHHARCGHYRHEGRWHHLRSHVHRQGCGHLLVGGVWILR